MEPSTALLFIPGGRSIQMVRPWAMVFLLFLVFRSVLAQESQSVGQITPELVGKWCFVNSANGGAGTQTNTCLTLSADGTYEFTLDNATMVKANSFFPGAAIQERDNGTWSAKGNTIYYKSSAHGEGSLQFQKINQPQNEGTPMIVVHGQAFASATPHDPW